MIKINNRADDLHFEPGLFLQNRNSFNQKIRVYFIFMNKFKIENIYLKFRKKTNEQSDNKKFSEYSFKKYSSSSKS